MTISGRQVAATLAIDVALVVVATLAALVVREDLTVSPERLGTLGPYLLATGLAALLVLPCARVPHGIWRFSSRSDYARILVSVLVVVLAALVATFLYDRLDHVSRSLPVLQATFAIGLLVAARALFRGWHTRRQALRRTARPFVATETPGVNVLLVGVSQLSEAYLRALEEFAPGEVRVVGLLGQHDRQVGRRLGGRPILGRVEAVRDVLASLETHGVSVDRIVIGCRPDALGEAGRRALLSLEGERDIDVQVLADQFAIAPSRAGPVARQRFEIAPERLALNRGRLYWRVKRALDVLAALVLLAVLGPVALLAAGALAISLGPPVLFWQQRPGLGGRPFRLYKLRTMRPAQDETGRPLTDPERTSLVGEVVRRSRLDEVPQLLNILSGEMSFIGPRPLLPRDQSTADRARLLVRPGLTGWAQVAGGRTISADDKAALDVWYVQNANFALDSRIVLRTIRVVLFGERVVSADIERAWHDLELAGVLRSQIKKIPARRKAA